MRLRFFHGLAIVSSALAIVLSTRTQAFTSIPIDGSALRMLVQGSGRSTVVFENGLGPSLEMWGKVQPAVSAFARTVTYDRAGVGLSHDGPGPRDGEHIADELHRALRLAHLPPPYVLVGASLGGPLVRIYAGMFPEDVAGLVLVDPTPDSETIDGAVSPEARAVRDTLRQAKASRVPAAIPLFLIRAEPSTNVPFATSTIRATMVRRQAEIAAESLEHRAWIASVPGGRLIVTHDSGHNIPIEQPDLVVETIRRVTAP